MWCDKMNHFVFDAYNSFRSRLDDILLIHEILEEIPYKMGLESVMPPFVIPYYNGVVPEDCGISGFVFLAGGHFTIHTFSYRETYFVDLVCPQAFSSQELQNTIKVTFPAEKFFISTIERGIAESFPKERIIDEQQDFGPHLFLDLSEYEGPKTMDELFEIFDTLPYQIGMTPIIRPYVIKNKVENENVISILTMIAESHISLHYFEESQKAYLDLFSCKFFDYDQVIEKLKSIFKGEIRTEILLARGSKYQTYKKKLQTQHIKSKSWLENT